MNITNDRECMIFRLEDKGKLKSYKNYIWKYGK